MSVRLYTKIIKYLNSKTEEQYTEFDKILKLHWDMKLVPLFKQYGFTDIEIFPEISKRMNEIQINTKFCALACDFGFYNDELLFFMRAPTTPDGADDDISIEMKYPDDFDLKVFLDEIVNKVKYWGLKG